MAFELCLEQVKRDVKTAVLGNENLEWLSAGMKFAPHYEDPGVRAESFQFMIDHATARLRDLVTSRKPYIMPWDPQVVRCATDGSLRQHILNLQIPSINNSPSLLLHRIGEQVEGIVSADEVAARNESLANIFQTGRGATKHS
ncbi:hypothetical protein H0H81_003449 [Sphagnurus paluster]|uniref:Uncharacterized protein n=1 Tax=Sphagnurus paluster TaxID=117069 RepID=A0A9P7GST9_9AGAR|nr:hypothetical protein H0H81_003449 [Sphagnurus paluster]